VVDPVAHLSLPAAGAPAGDGGLDVRPGAGGWQLDLTPDDGLSASRWLVDRLTAAPDGENDEEAFRLRRFTGPDPLPVVPLEGERPVPVDATHRSVIVGERLVVKWLRRVDDAEHPALRAAGHLTEVGFDGVPATLGALTWVSPSGRDLPCAFVTAYLPGATDGNHWCVEAVESGSDNGFPAELGRLAARLHVALGSPSSLLPLPVGAAGVGHVRRWHADGRRRLEETFARVKDLDDAPAGPEGDPARRVPSEVLAANKKRMESAIDRLLEVKGRTPVQHVHGDLHVGQVLSWSGGLSVIDFDGSPMVGGSPVQSPTRDVAHLLVSLDQVGRIVDRRSGFTRTGEMDEWSVRARAAFLDAYRAHLAEVERPDVLDPRLLPSFLVEQICQDLLYSADYLPRWAYASVEGLETMLDTLTPPG
jgi:maltokinase